MEQTVPVESAPINAFVASRGRGGRSRRNGRGGSPSNRGGAINNGNQRGFIPRNNNTQRGRVSAGSGDLQSHWRTHQMPNLWQTWPSCC